MSINIFHHESFNDFFTKDILDLIKKIENQIGDNYTPNKDLVLRFLKLDLNNVKVIWLGQDPYFQEGVATGRSFEASNIKSWDDKYKQVSLKNIIRGIYKAYNEDKFLDVNTYSNIMSERRLNNFELKEPKDFFDSLESQGVMFLNTYFTCEINKANSHRTIWEEFSFKLFNYIYQTNPNIIWFLWGAEASKVLNVIPNIKYYKSNHPMMCSIKKEEDFLNNKCFYDTKDIINWLG